MMKESNTALVILSGGQDSTTCLFWAKECFDEIHAVTFDYGQRHRIEINAARKVAAMAGVKTHEVIDVQNVLKSTSPLISGTELEQYENPEQMEEVIGDRVELTFVPMRNTLFFVIAANRAIALNCNTLVTGICQEDNANYPDCTQFFLESLERTVNRSLVPKHLYDENKAKLLKFLAPLMHFSKSETVEMAYNIPGAWDALAYSHTSYDGKYPPTDMNHANVLRAKGFEEAGLPDPLVLRAVREGLMEMPKTKNYQQA